MEHKEPNLYIKTYCPITALILVFVFGYGCFSFALDLINFLSQFFQQ